jgi:hypothetical protein
VVFPIIIGPRDKTCQDKKTTTEERVPPAQIDGTHTAVRKRPRTSGTFELKKKAEVWAALLFFFTLHAGPLCVVVFFLLRLAACCRLSIAEGSLETTHTHRGEARRRRRREGEAAPP